MFSLVCVCAINYNILFRIIMRDDAASKVVPLKTRKLFSNLLEAASGDGASDSKLK